MRFRKPRNDLVIAIAIILGSFAVCGTAQAATATFLPTADSYVRADRATSNFGLAADLRIDGSPATHGYLRFAPGGLSGSMTGATLKVFARTSSSTPVTLHGVTDNIWGETTITYANAPVIGAQISKSGSLKTGAWFSLDVKPLISGNGSVSMALKTTSSNSRTLDSRPSWAKSDEAGECDVYVDLDPTSAELRAASRSLREEHERWRPRP